MSLKDYLRQAANIPVTEAPAQAVTTPNLFEQWSSEQRQGQEQARIRDTELATQAQDYNQNADSIINERTNTDAVVDVSAGVAQGVWGTVTGGLKTFLDPEGINSLNDTSTWLDSFKSEQVQNQVQDYQNQMGEYSKAVENMKMAGELTDFEAETMIAKHAFKSMNAGQVEGILSSGAGSVGVMIAAAATGNPAVAGAAWGAMSASTLASPADIVLKELYQRSDTGDFNITHDDLLVSSERYRKAFEETGNEDMARGALFNYARNEGVWDAENIAGTLFEVAGEWATLRMAKLVKPLGKGEAAKTGVLTPLTSATKGMASETISEVVGDTTSTISANRAIAETGTNPDKNLFEGVGEGVIESAIGGVGGAATASVAGPVVGITKAVMSPKGKDTNTAPTTNKTDIATTAKESLEEAVKVSKEAETPTPVDESVSSISQAIAWNDFTEADGKSEIVRNTMNGSTDVLDALNKATDAVLGGKLSDAEVQEMGLTMVGIIGEIQTTTQMASDQIKQMDENDPRIAQLTQWNESAGSFLQNEELINAVTKATTSIMQTNAKIEADKALTEQGEVVGNLKNKLQVDPENITEDEITAAYNTISKSDFDAESGQEVFSNSEIALIKILHDSVTTAKSRAGKHAVQNQVMTDEVDGEKGASISKHAGNVVNALKIGAHDSAAQSMSVLKRFIESHNNKKAALELSRDSGNSEQSYKTTGANHVKPVERKISYFKEGGKTLLDNIDKELEFMERTYNTLRDLAPFEIASLPKKKTAPKAETIQDVVATPPKPKLEPVKPVEDIQERTQKYFDKIPKDLDSLNKELTKQDKALSSAKDGSVRQKSLKLLTDMLRQEIDALTPEPVVEPVIEEIVEPTPEPVVEEVIQEEVKPESVKTEEEVLVEQTTNVLKELTNSEYASLAQFVMDTYDYPKRLLSNLLRGRVGPATLADAPLEQIISQAQEIIDGRNKPTDPTPTKKTEKAPEVTTEAESTTEEDGIKDQVDKGTKALGNTPWFKSINLKPEFTKFWEGDRFLTKLVKDFKENDTNRSESYLALSKVIGEKRKLVANTANSFIDELNKESEFRGFKADKTKQYNQYKIIKDGLSPYLSDAQIEQIVNSDKGKDGVALAKQLLGSNPNTDSIVKDIQMELLSLYAPTKMAALLEKDESGNYKFPGDLLDAVTLGLVDFTTGFTTNHGQIPMDQQKLVKFHKSLGLDPEVMESVFNFNISRDGGETFYSENVNNVLTQGFVPAKTARREVSDSVMRILGVRGKNKSPEGKIYHPLENLIGSLMDRVIDANDAQTIQVEAGNGNSIKAYTVSTNNSSRQASAKGLAGKIMEEVSQEREARRYVNEKPVAKTKDKAGNTLSESQQKSVNYQQEIPAKVNTGVMNLFTKVMGKEGILNAFGYNIDTTQDLMLNRYHRESMEGKDLQLINALEELNVIQNEIAEKGLTESEAEIYFSNTLSSVSRSMMEGANNIQASKILRAALVPNQTEVNAEGFFNALGDVPYDSLSDTNKFLVLAYAQALGISIHNFNHDTNLEKLRNILNNDLFVDTAIGWFEASKRTTQTNVDDLIETSKELLGGDWNELSLQTMTEFGALLDAESKGTLDKFTTNAYIEADGITNGPFMASLLAGIDLGDATWVSFAANGGLYIGENINSNDYRSSKDSLPDNYMAVARASKDNKEALRAYATSLAQTKGVDTVNAFKNHDKIIDNFISSIFGHVSTDKEGNITFSRNTAKNPVTVSFYGSSVKGIASKFAGEAISVINELSTILLQNSDENGKLDLTASAISYFSDSPLANLTTDEKILKLQQLIRATEILTTSNKVAFVNPNNGAATAFISTQFGKDKKTTKPFSLATRTRDGYIVNRNQLQNGTLNGIQRGFLTENLLEGMAEPLSAALHDVAGSVLSATNIIQDVTNTYSKAVGNRFNELLEEAKNDRVSETNPDGYDPNFGFSQNQISNIIKELEVLGIQSDIAGRMFSLVSRKGVAESAEFENKSLGVANIDRVVYDETSRIKDIDELGVAGIPRFVIAHGDAATINHFVNKAAEQGIKKFLQVYDGINLSADNYIELSQLANDSVLQAIKDRPLNGLLRMVEKGFNSLPETPANKESLDNFKSLVSKVNENLDVLMNTEFSVDQLAAVGKQAYNEGNSVDIENGNDGIADELYNQVKAAKTTNRINSEYTKDVRIPFKIDKDLLLNVRDSFTGPARGVFNAVEKAFQRTNTSIVEGENNQFKGDTNVITLARDSNNEVAARTVLHEMVHATVFGAMKAIAFKDPRVSHRTQTAFDNLKKVFDEVASSPERHNNAIWGKAIDHAYAMQKRYVDNGMSPEMSETALIDEFLTTFLTTPDLLEQSANFEVKSKLHRFVGAIMDFVRTALGLPETAGNTLQDVLTENWAVLAQVSNTSTPNGSFNVAMSNFDTSSQERAVKEELFNIVNNLTPTERSLSDAEKLQDIDNSVTSLKSAGFLKTPNEEATFRAGSLAIRMAGDSDTQGTQGLYKMATHAVKNLKPEHFGNTSIEGSPSYHLAHNKYNAAMGVFGKSYSSVVPNLMGLVYASKEMKDAINQIGLPKGEKGFDKNSKFEEALGTLGYTAIHKMSNKLEGIGGVLPDNIVDTLVEGLVKKPEGRVSELAALPSNAYDKLNTLVVDALSYVGDKAGDVGNKISGESTLSKAVGLGITALGGVINSETAQVAGEGVTTVLNKIDGGKPWKDMVHDVIGRLPSNQRTYDLIKQVRSAVQRMRQMFVEGTPINIHKRFLSDPTEAQWSDLTKSMARTDIASIAAIHGVTETLKLLGNKKAVKDRINLLTDQILQSEGDGSLRLEKANQLSTFIITGKTGNNLLKNAHEIAYLYGEDSRVNVISKGLTNLIDEYVSLQAFSNSDNTTFENFNKNEKEGIHFALASLVGNHNEETRKAKESGVYGYKGYVPQPFDGDVMVIPDRLAKDYIKRGYVRVKDYKRPANDIQREPAGYYVSPLNSSRPFAQGIIQNAIKTINGVDAVGANSSTGRTLGVNFNILDLDKFDSKSNTDFGIIPMYDSEGNLVSLERSIDTEVLDSLGINMNLPELMGIWRGRQVEESLASNFNTVVIDHLNTEYEESNVKEQFINIFDKESYKDDKVLQDAVSILNKEALDYANKKYGKLMVKKEMLNNVVGYRQLGAASLFDGTINMKEGSRKKIAEIMESYIGERAYYHLVRGEDALRGLVGDAKQLIVVKSVIVPAINALSNVVHLMARGVPIADIAKGIPRKLAELERYSTIQKRIIEIESEILAAEGKQSIISRLNTERAVLEESINKMSIAPLLHAGEFASIVSAKIDQESTNLAKGKIAEYIEEQINKLDGGKKTIAKNLLMTKDTAIYQFLQKSVDYGDFIAKSVIYDDMVQRQKLSESTALGKVREEFINYDYLPGRLRGTLEGLGLLWFFNFKMRSLKIATSMIRENPLHTIVTMNTVPMSTPFGSLGIPIGDNFVYQLGQGALDNSIGPAMGIRSWELHPLSKVLF